MTMIIINDDDDCHCDDDYCGCNDDADAADDDDDEVLKMSIPSRSSAHRVAQN